MKRVYFDACAIIYLVEGSQPFQSKVKSSIAELLQQGDPVILTSRLSRLECRTGPLRDKNEGLLAKYESFFDQANFLLIDIAPAVIEQATDLRARYGFRTPDAIHLATAIVESAHVFLTGDDAFRRCTEVNVEILHP